LDVNSRQVIERYGIVMSPSVAINGVIKISGRIPKKEEVITIIKEAIQR